MGANGAGKYDAAGLVGPRPLPLGLSADPGGIPIYKLGDVVGGFGVELDGAYTLDRDVSNFDDNLEERIALSATLGEFEIPSERDGSRIFVAGKTLKGILRKLHAEEGINWVEALPRALLVYNILPFLFQIQ